MSNNFAILAHLIKSNYKPLFKAGLRFFCANGLPSPKCSMPQATTKTPKIKTRPRITTQNNKYMKYYIFHI